MATRASSRDRRDTERTERRVGGRGDGMVETPRWWGLLIVGVIPKSPQNFRLVDYYSVNILPGTDDRSQNVDQQLETWKKLSFQSSMFF